MKSIEISLPVLSAEGFLIDVGWEETSEPKNVAYEIARLRKCGDYQAVSQIKQRLWQSEITNDELEVMYQIMRLNGFASI